MYEEFSRDLARLCNAHGAAGLDDITVVVSEMLKPLCDRVWCDSMGNVLGMRRTDDKGSPTIMLQAHLDEIGMLVTDIDDLGFVHVSAAGGIDRRVLSAQKVCIHADKIYSGVFCSIPPHLVKDDSKLPELEEMGIDIGLSAKEARVAIPLGSRVTFAPNFKQMNNYTVTSKALDDRAGVMAVLHCLRRLQETDVNVSVAFCVQEEVGCRGAGPAVRQLDPKISFVTDVSFAAAPGEKAQECGRMGSGVMIGYSPVLDSALSDQITQIAKTHDIAYQTEVMGGSTGTDADVISKSNNGVRTGLFSIPLRYMHTPREMVDLRDIVATGELMARCAEEVSDNG